MKIGGDKIFLDGSPQGRTAWMRQPYAGESDYRGYPTLTDEQVYERMKSALERDVQLLAHCNGDGRRSSICPSWSAWSGRPDGGCAGR